MQRGTILKHHGSWCLRYYETVVSDGHRVRRKSFKKLALVSDEYPTKRSVLLLADKILAPLNAGQVNPESSESVARFIELHYLPYVKKELRPSTYVDYCTIFRAHLKSRLADTRLRDFRTMHAQRLLRDIPGVGHTSLLRIKSFLSGAFKHAKREGFLDGENPIHDVSVPGRTKRFQGAVYTMSEIEKIMEIVGKVDRQAFVVISVAAFAGLRHSELRGLRWSDYDGQSLKVSRSVWRTHVGPTKTEGSFGAVPVLPVLRKILDDHRARVKGRDEGYIFAGDRLGRPLNLINLANRIIKPTLEKEEKSRIAFLDEVLKGRPVEDRKSVEEQNPIAKWKGFHAFRRSLASNLYSCGVAPKVIQSILRHSDIGTTLAYYVSTPDDESRAALQKIEEWMAAIESADESAE